MEQSYKEKYEQALRVAKETYDKQPMYREWLEKMFPELKESEDEKIREALIRFHKSTIDIDGIKGADIISWLEKQGKCKTDCHRNHQDANYPNGCIVLEDFNGGEGFYKLNLDYLNKKQVEEVEETVRTWNKESKTSNENIKSCIGMCLTDANEQRFNDYNTTLKDCLDWLKKQGEQKFEMKTAAESLGVDSETYNKIIDECIYGDDKIEPKFKVGDKIYLKPEYRMPDDDTPIANTVFEIRAIDDKHYRFDGSYIFIEDQDKYELVEQKLSDEDMKELLRTEYEKGRADAIAEMQKEWSKEDKSKRNALIGLVEEIKRQPLKRLEDWDGYISWLKSLRPQNRWRPSEEQMIALKDALNDAIWKYDFKGSPIKEEVTRKHAETIESLYNDLKKLREE